MKKLMPLALIAAAAYVIWKYIINKTSGPSFWAGGNAQILETWKNIFGSPAGAAPGAAPGTPDYGTGPKARSAWDQFWNIYPDQRNNPVTGNPIPDATIYPNDPPGTGGGGPIMTAALPAGFAPGEMHMMPYFPSEPHPAAVATITPINVTPSRPIVNVSHPSYVGTIEKPWLQPGHQGIPGTNAWPWLNRYPITLPVMKYYI